MTESDSFYQLDDELTNSDNLIQGHNEWMNIPLPIRMAFRSLQNAFQNQINLLNEVKVEIEEDKNSMQSRLLSITSTLMKLADSIENDDAHSTQHNLLTDIINYINSFQEITGTIFENSDNIELITKNIENEHQRSMRSERGMKHGIASISNYTKNISQNCSISHSNIKSDLDKTTNEILEAFNKLNINVKDEFMVLINDMSYLKKQRNEQNEAIIELTDKVNYFNNEISNLKQVIQKIEKDSINKKDFNLFKENIYQDFPRIETVMNSVKQLNGIQDLLHTYQDRLNVLDENAKQQNQMVEKKLLQIEETNNIIHSKPSYEEINSILNNKINNSCVNKEEFSLHNKRLDRIFPQDKANTLPSIFKLNKSVGRWLSTIEHACNSHVRFTEEVVNTDNNNFSWETGSSQIIISKPGIYDISFVFCSISCKIIFLLNNVEFFSRTFDIDEENIQTQENLAIKCFSSREFIIIPKASILQIFCENSQCTPAILTIQLM